MCGKTAKVTTKFHVAFASERGMGAQMLIKEQKLFRHVIYGQHNVCMYMFYFLKIFKKQL